MTRALDGYVATAVIVAVYVLTLYGGRASTLKSDRDSTEVIARRFLTTTTSSIVSVALAIWAIARGEGGVDVAFIDAFDRERWGSMRRALGLSPRMGAWRACAYGLVVALTLLAGEWTSSTARCGRYRELTSSGRTMWMNVRDFAHAPLMEELVFRACATATMRASGASALAASAWSTALFALAHAHHFFAMRARGASFALALRSTRNQLAYTSAFGALASRVFVRTESLVAATTCHAACNLIGPPTIPPLGERRRRTIITALGVIGALCVLVRF
ncbi:CAAX amino terminal protease [Ostreococcus tauri]|uniref:intramembrane prenyl-peptidase Rce1 n=1 Tax=Ostreococcus tauri TaxID=70448 RepID=A0A090M8P4_OSTTA|nr:CAAX amino terminal protease [Ostreococcus tauri]CEF99077.1 CAAX amino terminal protease [Ostreococcus tauri]|eukprot:XP_003081239.2 CAAX amino terminal protease [Ostreococcus tauri]